MANPVLGTDVIIKFVKNDNYITYGCATNIEITYNLETKSTKTVGDGAWSRVRGQKISATINLSGVIAIDQNTPTAFDLLEYLKNMTDVAYSISFIDDAGGLMMIDGNALPTTVRLSGGSDGFATGDITLENNGDPAYISPVNPPTPNPGNPNTCVADIENAHTDIVFAPTARRYVYIDSMVNGSASISRWDYSIDGGGVLTAFTDGIIPTSWRLPDSTVFGTHTLTITPICDNGFPGTPFTMSIP